MGLYSVFRIFLANRKCHDFTRITVPIVLKVCTDRGGTFNYHMPPLLHTLVTNFRDEKNRKCKHGFSCSLSFEKHLLFAQGLEKSRLSYQMICRNYFWHIPLNSCKIQHLIFGKIRSGCVIWNWLFLNRKKKAVVMLVSQS